MRQGRLRPAPNGPTQTISSPMRGWALHRPHLKHGVLTGTISDEAGEPAVVSPSGHAPERLLRQARYQPAGQATTDDRGVYRIAPVPGDYVVAVVDFDAVGSAGGWYQLT